MFIINVLGVVEEEDSAQGSAATIATPTRRLSGTHHLTRKTAAIEQFMHSLLQLLGTIAQVRLRTIFLLFVSFDDSICRGFIIVVALLMCDVQRERERHRPPANL